jgi:hypothetical protein
VDLYAPNKWWTGLEKGIKLPRSSMKFEFEKIFLVVGHPSCWQEAFLYSYRICRSDVGVVDLGDNPILGGLWSIWSVFIFWSIPYQPELEWVCWMLSCRLIFLFFLRRVSPSYMGMVYPCCNPVDLEGGRGSKQYNIRSFSSRL